MNKKSVLHVLLASVFLAVFNTVFFVIGGTDHSASVWISYGFIHFSYIMLVLTPFLTRKSSSAAVFGFSLYSISAVYFFAEFIVGLLFVLIGSESYKAALVIQVIIAGIYAIILLGNMLANEYTADSVKKREEEIDYIKTASSRIKLLLDKADNKKANKEIEKAYDLLHSSPSKSIPSVRATEAEILLKVSGLEGAVKANSVDDIIAFAGEIITLTEQRNGQIKLAN